MNVGAPAPVILIIGGVKSHGPGEHDFPNGIRLLARLVEFTARRHGLAPPTIRIEDDWPDDPRAFADAAAIVWYFDGLGPAGHPLLDPERRRRFEPAMRRGAGLVALHQSWAAPPGDETTQIRRWLGGVRPGMFDRTTETVTVDLGAVEHPIARGVGTLTVRDEFYPTVEFAEEGVTPILTARVHPEFRDGVPFPDRLPGETRDLAWAYERDPGRSFAYSGLHYLRLLDDPGMRCLLLNAILWTAGYEVPETGFEAAARYSPTTSR
jgi:ribosome modulation factor